MIILGIDTGGTFTDLVGFDKDTKDVYVNKVSSTPGRPEMAIVEAIETVGFRPEEISFLVLGTTLGVNALIQRTGSKVLYLTTEGFEDIPYIQRINREHSYDLKWQRPKPLVERRHCIGVKERIKANGEELISLRIDEEFLERIGKKIEKEGIESIATCFLFSYVNSTHEEKLESILREKFPEISISTSHKVVPVWKEYERAITTIIDAYIKPIFRRFAGSIYLALKEVGCRGTITFLKSNGGRMLWGAVTENPSQTLISGLAGGVIAGKYFGKLANARNVITLDMGGTSCDIGLITEGMERYLSEFQVEWGIPSLVPCVDVTSIGAGGGSIAWIDKGGMLRVGPKSAGAEPGPACYGKGGVNPTVTDANLVLGRLDPDYFLGGKMSLNVETAKTALRTLGKRIELGLEEVAQAIVDISNENMMNAIRLITVWRGIDPREYSLVAAGGAGPLHASAIAKGMGISTVITPPHPGLFSAFGGLISDYKVDKSWTRIYRSDQMNVKEIDRNIARLTEEALTEIKQEGFSGLPRLIKTISMRYRGQNYEHDVGIPSNGKIDKVILQEAFEKFALIHKEYYGYHIPGEIIELVRFNVTAIGKQQEGLIQFKKATSSSNLKVKKKRSVYFKDQGFVECPIYDREYIPLGSSIEGPAVIEEMDSTILVEPGQQLDVNENGLIIIKI